MTMMVCEFASGNYSDVEEDAIDAADDADDCLKRPQQSLSSANMAMETMVPIATTSVRAAG